MVVHVKQPILPSKITGILVFHEVAEVSRPVEAGRENRLEICHVINFLIVPTQRALDVGIGVSTKWRTANDETLPDLVLKVYHILVQQN